MLACQTGLYWTTWVFGLLALVIVSVGSLLDRKKY